MNTVLGVYVSVRGRLSRAADLRNGLTLRQRFDALAKDESGINDMVGTILVLVAVLVLGGAVIAFAKGGGLTWFNNTLNSATSQTP